LEILQGNHIAGIKDSDASTWRENSRQTRTAHHRKRIISYAFILLHDIQFVTSTFNSLESETWRPGIKRGM
jgi:hypothetical protein